MSALAEVAAVPARMQQAVDRGDIDAFADLIAADCSFTFSIEGDERRIEGKNAIVDMTRAMLTGGRSKPPVVHLVGSVIAEARGEDAAFVSSICLYVGVGDELSLRGLGEYEDELIRERGTWRIARRVIVMKLGSQMAAGFRLGA